MAPLRIISRSLRTNVSKRAFTSSTSRLAAPTSEGPAPPKSTFTASPENAEKHAPLNARVQDTAEQYRKFMMERPINPHMTNTTSTIANEMPSVGADNAPPELLTSADPSFTNPKDSVPENTERMTGGQQSGLPEDGPNKELKVGELEGSEFTTTPKPRDGEDAGTIRARLLYQSRKRGTLESDLLMSTFADRYLPSMTLPQLLAYDRFLDENDWDIYYWATQEPTPTSRETAEGAGPEYATANAAGSAQPGEAYNTPEPLTKTDRAPETASYSSASDKSESSSENDVKPQRETAHWQPGGAQTTEWAQTVGTFKPAYRPVPARWKNSEILALLRAHVIDNSAGGVRELDAGEEARVDKSGLADVAVTGGQGLAFMPKLMEVKR